MDIVYMDTIANTWNSLLLNPRAHDVTYRLG